MIALRLARAFGAGALLFVLFGASACVPGDLLGAGGDAGPTRYVPDASKAPPPHGAAQVCGDADPSHLCLALSYVVFTDESGRNPVPRSLADAVVRGVNSVWSQCHVQFYLENYEAADPRAHGLPYQPTAQAELTDMRAEFGDANRLTVITTGEWQGGLGAQGPNAWTEMPAIGPFGTVVELSAATVYGLIAHELGHYLNLEHAQDVYNVMNPTVFSNSINIVDRQCADARATAISFWGAALR